MSSLIDHVGVEKREISSLATRCEALFTKSYADPQVLDAETCARAGLQHERFHLWASYLGVFAEYSASLDKRLGHIDEIRNLVVQLLELMLVNLQFLVPGAIENSFSTDSSDVAKTGSHVDLQGTTMEALDAVEATITRLNKLGSAIRKYSASSLDSRVKVFTEKHGDDGYRKLAKGIVHFKYKTVTPSLKDQLAASMVTRRQTLRYVREHQKKLWAASTLKRNNDSKDLPDTASPGFQRIDETQTTLEKKPRRGPTSEDKLTMTSFAPITQSKLRFKDPGPSVTNASSFRPTKSLLVRLQSGDGASVVSSSKKSTTFMPEDLADYPEPPKREPGKPDPTCPFCFRPLQQSDLKSTNWRRHVNQDLRPFVCISDKCSQSPHDFGAFFETFEIWAKHMRDSHSTKWPRLVHKPTIWRCDVDHPEDLTVFTCTDEDDFEEHLNSQHSNCSPAARKAISRTSRVLQRRPPNTCPLCGYDVSALEVESRDSSKMDEFSKLNRLAKHIAGHVQRLAFDSVKNLNAELDDDVSVHSVGTSKGMERDGSDLHPPSGHKDLSHISLAFKDDGSTMSEGGQAHEYIDHEWSRTEFDALVLPPDLHDISTSLDAEDTQHLSIALPDWGRVKDFLAEPQPETYLTASHWTGSNLSSNYYVQGTDCKQHGPQPKPAEASASMSTPLIEIPETNPRQQRKFYTGDSDLDGIKGNPTPGLPLRPALPTEHTWTILPRAVGPQEYRTFMLEYLAETFGIDNPPSDADLEIGDIGRHLESLTTPDDDQNDNEIPFHLDDPVMYSRVQLWPKQRTTLISNSEMDSLPGRPAVDPTGGRARRTRNPLKSPEKRDPKDGEAITLSEVIKELTPISGCDRQFFPACTNFFLSDSKVWSYLTEARVRSILGECGLGIDDSTRYDLAKIICGMPSSKRDIEFISYRKILTILILLHKQDRIRHFIEQQLHDGLLPLRNVKDPYNLYQLGLPDSDACHPCFEGWDNSDFKGFAKHQQELSAPFFKYDDRCQHYKFPSGIALPFRMEVDTTNLRVYEGAMATVIRVKLAEAHSNLHTYTHQSDSSKRLFAVKKLHYSDRDAFTNEASILGRLHRTTQAKGTCHLIRLLATFEVGSEPDSTFYFLFPCADGNLRDFWGEYSDIKDEDRVSTFSKWMAHQFHGLSEALNILHNYFLVRRTSDEDPRNWGIHGDIMPESILYFRNWNGPNNKFGILQLADFGVAQFHTNVAVNQASPLIKAHPYCPPEVELVWKAGQSLDIWALGCLFLEFSIWLIFGNEGLKRFMHDRMSQSHLHDNLRQTCFFQIERTSSFFFPSGLKVAISDGVLTWIENVHRQPYTPMFIHVIVDLVLKEMLVLPQDPSKVPDSANNQEPQETRQTRLFGWFSRFMNPHRKRIKIAVLERTLEGLLDEQDAYFFQPSPYELSSFVPPPVHTSRAEVRTKRKAGGVSDRLSVENLSQATESLASSVSWATDPRP